MYYYSTSSIADNVALAYHAGHEVHERLEHAAQLAGDAGGVQHREQTAGAFTQ